MPTFAKLSHFSIGYASIIEVAENSGRDLIDYQIKLVLDENWDGWRYVKPDGSDIYVLDDNFAPLYHHIETFNPSTKNAVIWVKLPKLPSLSKKRILLIFGGVNPFKPYRDPFKVFEFFDDFRGCVPHGWTSPPAIKKLPDGTCVADISTAVTQTHPYFDLPQEFDVTKIGVRVLFDIQHVSQGTYGPRAEADLVDLSNGYFYFVKNEIGSSVNNYYWLGYYNGSWNLVASNGTNISYGVWYRNSYLLAFNGYIEGKIEGSTVMSGNVSLLLKISRIRFDVWDTGNEYYVTNIRVTKYVKPEPTVSILKTVYLGRDLDLY